MHACMHEDAVQAYLLVLCCLLQCGHCYLEMVLVLLDLLQGLVQLVLRTTCMMSTESWEMYGPCMMSAQLCSVCMQTLQQYL